MLWSHLLKYEDLLFNTIFILHIYCFWIVCSIKMQNAWLHSLKKKRNVQDIYPGTHLNTPDSNMWLTTALNSVITFVSAGSSQNLLHTAFTPGGCSFMQSIPAAVVPTVHTGASLYQPPHLLPTAWASCSSNTGDCVSVALCEVHALL